MQTIDKTKVDEIIDGLLGNNDLTASPEVWYGLHQIKNLQPVATDINVGDTISRQAAIEKVRTMQTYKLFEDISLVDKALVQTELMMLPTVQPEPSIPLSWIEKHIEWLKSLDNEFANLVVGYISVMVKKWRDEQDE